MVNDETNPTFNVVKPISAQCLGLEQVRVSNLIINARRMSSRTPRHLLAKPTNKGGCLNPGHAGAQPRASEERTSGSTSVSAFRIMVNKHKRSMPNDASANGVVKLC